MQKVFIPDPDEMTKRGFGRWKNAPVLFNDRYEYLRVPSRYLRERATRQYSPAGELHDYPRPATLRAVAYRLCHFFNWGSATDCCWMTASYEDVLEYQNSQLRSLGTAGKSVTPKTANRRADEVTHFLRWASLNGLRPSFHYETKTVDRIINGRRRTFLIRLGRSREALYEDDPTHFPTAAQIAAWLKSVLTIRGEAKWLACRFVLETGARKSEVSNLKVSDWPSDERIAKAIQQNSAFVHMTLKHGTKGGRPRQIRVPLAFAMQVQAWRKKRNTYAYRYYKRTGRRIDLMFLSDSGMHAGTPLSGQTIWRCFREVEPRPDRWTTHKGRHAYAVFLVLYALESEAQASHSSLKTKGPEWIYDRGRHWLMLLKKQFGHISEETTQIYLRWLVATAGISDYAAGWHRYLNDEAGE